jgi:hypothetical protein
MSCDLLNLTNIARGLNIEGYRPCKNMPVGCKWFNVIQVIDEPLEGINFDDIMKIVNENKYSYIEQSIGLDINKFINQLVDLICDIAKDHKNVLVHIHQFEKTTILHKTLQEKIKNVKFITDKTHYYEYPVDYKIDYPNIDALISISQCAGFGLKAGSWIVPTSFMDFDVKNNIIYTNKIYVDNHMDKYVKFEYVRGNILVVNDLWNPSVKSPRIDQVNPSVKSPRIDQVNPSVKSPRIDQVNPSRSQNGISLVDKNDAQILSFVKENTKILDGSHI